MEQCNAFAQLWPFHLYERASFVRGGVRGERSWVVVGAEGKKKMTDEQKSKVKVVSGCKTGTERF